MKRKFRAYITYGYTPEDFLRIPDLLEEVKETGLGFIDTPDLIDFENERVKYDCDWYENDRFRLMQFTGLKDKNGKAIYEGDIVKAVGFKDCIGVVKYCFEKAAFVLDEIEPQEDSSYYPFLSQFENGFEILGNVYKTEVKRNENLQRRSESKKRKNRSGMGKA